MMDDSIDTGPIACMLVAEQRAFSRVLCRWRSREANALPTFTFERVQRICAITDV